MMMENYLMFPIHENYNAPTRFVVSWWGKDSYFNNETFK